MTRSDIARLAGAAMMLGALAAAGVRAQTLPGASASPAAPAPAAPHDSFGRTTPRGTVLGFLDAARKGDNDLARYYLNVPADGPGADELAHQLFVVLDARLPARLPQLSDAPEGSRADPLAPDEERVGVINDPAGPFYVVVERVKRPQADSIWLFSAKTLARIPAAFEDVEQIAGGGFLPRFLIERHLFGLRLYEWLALLVGLPLVYFVIALLNRAMTPAAAFVGRRFLARADGSAPNALPAPARLLILGIAGRWLIANVPLSLLLRQYLANAAAITIIGSVAWLLVLLNGEIEHSITRHISRANFAATVSLLRVGRRLADLVVVVAALLATLRHFGVDPTPLLAGLGVGGIAVALAAQKTLENIIAGASLIFDQAVRVGDFLRVGTIEGTVDEIGLRSTRIRTNDRSLVSVPNSQIANMSLETLSVRDKFWFHPTVGLRYDTTAGQMRLVLDGIRQTLARQAQVDGTSVRVRFIRLNAYSLDVEVFAYVFARDWPHFLEIQEELLLKIADIVSGAGTGIAFPTQTMYMEGATSSALAPPQLRESPAGVQEIKT